MTGVIILLTIPFLIIESGVTISDKKKVNTLVHDINSTKVISLNFQEIIKKIEPDKLNEGVYFQFASSPSFLCSYEVNDSSLSRFNNLIHLLGVSRNIERNSDILHCYSYKLNKLNFPNSITGVDQASVYYFNKEIEHLNEDQLIALYLFCSTPFLYTKSTDQEYLNQKIKEIKNSW